MGWSGIKTGLSPGPIVVVLEPIIVIVIVIVIVIIVIVMIVVVLEPFRKPRAVAVMSPDEPTSSFLNGK